MYVFTFWLSAVLISVHRCKCSNLLPSTVSVVWGIDILKVLQSFWWLAGSLLYWLLLLIVGNHTAWFHFPWLCILITVVMVLRVYAMWNKSKRILYILLCIYVPQVVVSFAVQVIYSNPTYLSGMSQAKLQSHMFPLCSATFFSSHSCPSHWFLFLQSFIDPSLIQPTVGLGSSPTYSQCRAFIPCYHFDFDGVSCNVQSNQGVAA